MTDRPQQLRVVATTLLLVVSMVAGIAVVTDNASSLSTTTNDYSKSDYDKTTRGHFLGLQSHSVSETDQGFNSYTVAGFGIDEPFRIRWYQFHWPLKTDDCGVSNVDGAGIDRGNDDSGTSTDESLVNQYEYQGFRTRNQTNGNYPPLQPRGHRVAPDGWNHREVVEFDFYDPDDFGGSTVTLNPDDELVFGFRNCAEYTHEGWYRSWIYLNGTTESGKDVEFFALSKWVYVCEDCSSRQEAREKLGPPPGEGSDQQTATATATATPGSQSTATPNSQSTATPGSQSTDMPASQTTTTTTQGTEPPEQTTDSTGGTTATAGGTTSTNDGQSSRGSATVGPSTGSSSPTFADGPGLGLLTALTALAALLLVGLFRDR
jgi:hypothetical protein